MNLYRTEPKGYGRNAVGSNNSARDCLLRGWSARAGGQNFEVASRMVASGDPASSVTNLKLLEPAEVGRAMHGFGVTLGHGMNRQ